MFVTDKCVTPSERWFFVHSMAVVQYFCLSLNREDGGAGVLKSVNGTPDWNRTSN